MTEPNYATSTGGESRPVSANLLANTGNGNATADENLNVGPRASMADPGYGPRTGRIGPDLFVVVTFLLSLIGWILVLVAQAYVAAKFSNDLVRILWFGFVIQTILSMVVFKVVIGSRSYDAAYAYGVQVAILSSIACVFAVMGVDRTIYVKTSGFPAVGAGWLILAIVDLLWVIYFTSPPQSPVGRLASGLGDLRGPKKEEETHGKVEKIGRSTDAFAMSPVHAGGSAQRMSATLDGGQSQSRPNVGQVWNEQRTTYASQSDGGAGGGATTGPVSEPGASSVRGSAKAEPEPEPEPGPEPEPEAKWKAEALYDYPGSKEDPNELAFKKGQSLQILDKSGKWWLARAKDGRKGIAPSNYLRLL